MSAWYLFFSPDFVGYDNPKLDDHILEGNAYVYKFDVSDIVNKGAPNEVVIENIGDEVAAQYTNRKISSFTRQRRSSSTRSGSRARASMLSR